MDDKKKMRFLFAQHPEISRRWADQTKMTKASVAAAKQGAIQRRLDRRKK